jgi:DNA-binding NarL/FixJ family response regulator
VGVRDQVSVLIADDNGFFREALEAILQTEDEIQVIGRAGDGEEAARLAAELEPDVILMDLSMPVLDGFEATRAINDRVPEAAVVVLTGSAEPSDIERARQAGAAAYVTKDRIAAELVDAILAAASRP